MFFSKQNRIIERNHRWYLETQTGFEGPFSSRREAMDYKRVRDRADMARVEFAGLEDSLSNT